MKKKLCYNVIINIIVKEVLWNLLKTKKSEK